MVVVIAVDDETHEFNIQIAGIGKPADPHKVAEVVDIMQRAAAKLTESFPILAATELN